MSQVRNCNKSLTTSFRDGRPYEWLLYVVLGMCLLGGYEAAQSQPRKVEMQCGKHTWTITCGRDNTPVDEDSRECNQNKLSIRAPDGKTRLIPDPPMTTEFHDDKRSVMIEGTTPTAMSCLNKNDASYVSVEYSRGPGSVGLFLDRFISSGQRLTSVGVPIVKFYKDPFIGINWKQLPKKIRIEEEK